MLADDPGDVVIDHHHLVDQSLPLDCKHPDGGRPAADAHPAFRGTVNDGGRTRLHHDMTATVNVQGNGLSIAKRQKCGAGHAAFGLGATGQVMNTAKRQHL